MSESDDGLASGQNLTRRGFVGSGFKIGGALVAAGAVGTLGRGFFFPQPSDHAREGFPATSCDEESASDIVGKRPVVLVAYASEFGTTGEVADRVGQTLCRLGARVQVRHLANIDRIDRYAAVVVGGPIQFDRWMSEATEFVQEHEEALSKIPASYFFTCMTLSEQSVKTRTKAAGYAAKVAATSSLVEPASVGQFAGVLDYDRMSFATRLASKVIYTALGVKDGDYRDWAAIESWTDSVERPTSA